MDLGTVLVTSTTYETPCELAEHEDVVRPVLFDGALERPSPTHWRGRLIPNLRLSNGEPLTATELATHLDACPALRGVKVTAQGDILDFHTNNPEPRFEHRLISRSTLVALRRGNGFVGTGPFRIAEGRADRIVLERNPHHRHPVAPPVEGGQRPDTIEFWVLPRGVDGNATALIEALKERRIDFTVDLTRDEVERVQGVRRTFRPGDSTCLLSFNTEGAFAEPELRRGAAMALDRHALADLCYQNPVAYVARGVLPPQLARVGDDLRHDPAAGRALIQAHGPGRPLRMMRVWAPRPYIPRPAAVALELKGQLADVGLDVIDDPAPNADAYYARLVSGDYDLVLGGWIADTGNPAEFLHSVLHSRMVPTPEQSAATACNMARVRDDELDRRLDTCHLDGSDASFKAVQARVDETHPLVPLMYGPSVAVHLWRVRGLAWKDRRLPNLAEVELDPLTERRDAREG